VPHGRAGDGRLDVAADADVRPATDHPHATIAYGHAQTDGNRIADPDANCDACAHSSASRRTSHTGRRNGRGSDQNARAGNAVGDICAGTHSDAHACANANPQVHAHALADAYAHADANFHPHSDGDADCGAYTHRDAYLITDHNDGATTDHRYQRLARTAH